MTAAHGRRPWSDRTTRILAWAAVAWTVAVGLALLAVPTGTSVVAVASNGSEVVTTTTTSHETLLEHEGASAVGLVLVPVAVALTGAVGRGATVRRRRIAAGSLLAVACVLGATTLGIFYVPAAAVLLTAGLKRGT